MKNVSLSRVVVTLSIMVMAVTAQARCESPVLGPPVISGTTVSLSWQPVEDVSSYTLYYAPIPYLGEQTIGSIDMGSQTELTAELWEGAAFYVAVTAHGDGIESGFSNIGQCIITGTASPYDDFSSDRLDGNKWAGRWWSGQLEQVREITEGKLVSKVSGTTTDGGSLLNQLGFVNPESINSISAKVAYIDGTIDETYTWNCGAQIEGFFYEEAAGSVWAGIFLEHRNGAVFVSSAVASPTGFIAGEPFMLPVTAGQEYTLKIEYDGNNQFTFWADDESHTITGPERTGVSNIEFKALTTGVWWNGGAEPGTGYISATFDDVVVNEIPYDDFSATALEASKWGDGEVVREIRDGQLQMNVQLFSFDDPSTKLFVQADQITDYFQADVTVQSESVLQGEETTGQARLYGTYYNDTYDRDYNGAEGDIYGRIQLTLYPDESITPFASIIRCNDTDCDSTTDLFKQELNCTAQVDVPVPLAIEKRGTALVFSCNGSQLEYQLSGNLYAPGSPSRILRTRANVEHSGDYGYMKTRFDNVYVNKP